MTELSTVKKNPILRNCIFWGGQ